MRIYLDDNFSDQALAGKLRNAGHEVVRPVDVGLLGVSDAKHLEHAIRQGLVVLTKDRDDFEALHDLLDAAGGNHHGILVVGYENNRHKDMNTKHVVAAVGKLKKSGAPVVGQLIFLNQWR